MGIPRQQLLALFADMQHDSAALEKHEAVLLEDRHLSERLQGAVFRAVLLALREQTRPVGKAGLFERPPHAQIAHLAFGEVRNPLERRDGNHVTNS